MKHRRLKIKADVLKKLTEQEAGMVMGASQPQQCTSYVLASCNSACNCYGGSNSQTECASNCFSMCNTQCGDTCYETGC